MLDLEVTEPFPPLSLTFEETGVGLLLRKLDRPIAFFLEPLPAGTVLDGYTFGELVKARCATELVQAELRDERPPTGSSRLPLDLTVAVCTRGGVEHLGPCLDALLALCPGTPERFQLLVVGNGSLDEQTYELMAHLPGVRYVREIRPGLNVARNRALAEVDTEFLAFVSDDCTVDHGWLAGLEEAWNEHPEAAAVSGSVLPSELSTDAQVIFEYAGGLRRGFEKLQYSGPGVSCRFLPQDLGGGYNMAFRSEVLRHLGGFDGALDAEPLSSCGGELDIFHRLVQANNFVVYEPRALVFRRHPRGHPALRRQLWADGAASLAFCRKTYHCDPRSRPELRRALARWVASQLVQLCRSARGASPLSADLVAARLAGGMLTAIWLYPCSQRRSQPVSELGW